MKQRRDLINPDSQGTVDEHFRVAILQSCGHKLNKIEDGLDLFPSEPVVTRGELHAKVDVEVVVYNISPVATGASTNSVPCLLPAEVGSSLDAVRELVLVGETVSA